MATSLTIPPTTFPAGVAVLGPIAIADAWTHFELILDIIALVTSMDVLVELSTDGGTSWQTLISEGAVAAGVPPAGFGTPVPGTTEHLVADWDPPLPAGLVRATITTAVAFLSSGGSMQAS